LQDVGEFEEVFYELHEDLLIKLKNDTFIGIQVKTRKDLKGNYFSVNDEEIKGAIGKFIDHEKNFPNKFSKYQLVTNCGFGNNNNASNLDHILDYVKEKSDLEQIKNNKDIYEHITIFSKNNGISEEAIINIYKKINTIKWVELDRCDVELMLFLSIYCNIDNFTVAKNLANELIELVLRSSASICDNPRKKYLDIFNDPKKMLVDMVIEAKRINRDKISSIIAKFNEDKLKIIVNNPLKIENIPKGFSKIEKKMIMGEIPADYIERFKDNKASLDYLLASWTNKYGVNEATMRYNKIHKLIKDDCQDVEEKIDKTINPYGKELLLKIKNKVENTHENYIKTNYLDCHPLHLLGDVSNLTQDCYLWFSEKFEINGD
jgi:hypothetical protein